MNEIMRELNDQLKRSEMLEKTKTTKTLKFPINMGEGITKYICQFKWPQVRILLWPSLSG